MRYILAFTAVIITTARGFLAEGSPPSHDLDAMHAAFTKSVMLHVTVWTRAYTAETEW